MRFIFLREREKIKSAYWGGMRAEIFIEKLTFTHDFSTQSQGQLFFNKLHIKEACLIQNKKRCLSDGIYKSGVIHQLKMNKSVGRGG